MNTSSSTSVVVRRRPNPQRRARQRRQRGGVYQISRIRNPLPMVMDCDFEFTFTGGIAIGNALTNIFSINVASFYRPLSQGVTYTVINTATGPTPFACTPTLGSSATANPIGYASFAGTNYQFTKVLEYDLRITTYPQAAGDTCATCMVPTGGQETPYSGSWTFNILAGQNSAILGRSVYGANSALNTLRLRGTPWKALGYTRAQWLAMTPSAINAGPNLNSYVLYGLGVMDGAGNAGIIVVDICLRQRVRLSDPQQLAT